MIKQFLLLIFISLTGVTLISNLISEIIKRKDTKKHTTDVRIISREAEADNKGKIHYYVTFEFINNKILTLLVPKRVYDLAIEKISGRLTYESMKFISFIQDSKMALENCYQKNYKIKKALF